MKEQVQELTHVPIERQKLLCSKKKGSIHWKGSLSNDFIFTVADDAKPISHPLVVTLIGSAEAIQAPPKVRTQFVEDMTDEERRAVDEATEQVAAEHAIGMIPALQLPPHLRDDRKQETYQYNRLVSGLPQRQIEDLVRQENLVGEVAMTMGSELRRAYVNDLAVIQRDGTLISALDDGHVQLWRHGEIQHDVIHYGGDGGVDCVVSIDSSSNKIDFCTSGRGSIKLWSNDAKDVVTIPTPVPGTSPVSLVQVPILQNNSNLICLAARFQITQHSHLNQFHLVPQDAEGRRRRAMAEAQEAARREVMNKMSRSIQVMYGSADGTSQLQSHLLTVEDENAAPITCLTAFATQDNSSAFLVSGDAIGGIGFWKPQVVQENGRDVVKCTQLSYTQLLPDNEGGSSIVCMEPIGDGRHLAVSTRMTSGRTTTSAMRVSVPLSQAVYVLNVGSSDGNVHISRILTGHTKDAVHCMQALPNGDLLTGGGKLDATLQLWSSAQLSTNDGADERNEPLQSSQASQQISSLGYVFAMATLPDQKKGSSRFAIAAARYNTVKIIL